MYCSPPIRLLVHVVRWWGHIGQQAISISQDQIYTTFELFRRFELIHDPRLGCDPQVSHLRTQPPIHPTCHFQSTVVNHC